MYSNRLETAVARFKSEKIEAALNVAAADGDNRNTFMRESMQRLEEAIGALEEAGGKIRELLQEYAETLSSLENPPEKETKDFEEYTSKAEKSLVIAFDYIVLLQARLRAFKSFKEDIISSEEMISIYVGRPSSPRTQERNEYQKKPFHKPLNTCMYCGKNHKSGECDKMDPRSMDSDFFYIYKYLQGQSVSGFENDLTLTIEAIHRQVFVFGTLRNDWEHLKSNENFVLGGPGEQVLLIIELLRTAEQAVEQIKKLATRFVLTDRLFEALVQNGKVNPSLRRDWLRKKHKFDVEADKVLEFV
ncbi:hypothetical protein OSTOST_17077, partial [Ostertagia ostertagi]